MHNITWNYYAIRPLENILVSKSAVALKRYISGIGLTDPITISFSEIYLDEWATNFLTAMEHFIGVFFPPSVAGKPDPDIARVLKAKADLSNAIPDGVAAIFQTNPDAAQIKEAQAALQKALAGNLSKAYGVAAILVSNENDIQLLWQNEAVDEVPIPSRAYPAMPALTGQEIAATYPDADTIEQAKQINYAVFYSHRSVYQDTLYISIEHPQSAVHVAHENNGTGLFDSLTQFVIAYADLQNDLPEHYNPSDEPNDVLRIAIKTFADMAEAVAGAWAGYWSKHTVPNITLPRYTYSLTKQFDASDPDYIASVILRMYGNETTVVPTLFLDDTIRMTAHRISDTAYLYEYKEGQKSTGGYMKLALEGIDIFSEEEWSSSLFAARNNFDSIEQSFVFKTGTTFFPYALAPEIVQNGIIVLDPTIPRSAALTNVFTTLFADVTPLREMRIDITYTKPGQDGLPPVPVPVLLIPNAVYSELLVQEIDGQLTDWLRINAPEEKGHFTMELTVFNATNRPVLIVKDVRFE